MVQNNSKLPSTACAIIIGNEILSGQTQDANVIFIAKHMAKLGILFKECRFIQDDEAQIITAITECSPKYSYVFTTGGIGPTHDDITSMAVAKAFNLPFTRNNEAFKRIFSVVPQRSEEDSRQLMANMPEGAILIDNPISHAPGFQINNVFVLAGVPDIMQAMLLTLTPRLSGGQQRHSKAILCLAFESRIANDLREIQKEHPNVEIGSYPTWHISKEKGVKLVFKSFDLNEIETVERKVMAMAEKLGYQAEEIEI
ncbi:competence/damage-inducible protein A [Candidatus Nucleicultrix amoebiphila]|jgi:molybdenum cofactor synthesis domain-containing protein|uniref:MoaB/Mog domain-containing protein n=1 Tax=Candidatus Nucleicultrix amoebiphila FS5 TaxID=1414854 RepID=A0A1W6N2F6_9PROT|nr:molybdopterin-binding protein [Candidatus Nucleicultrix amoebiphila]ARN84017.1 hypothetical protein GQ61_00105 [Candidatus Nucleicultrix amoebiphila FS5]